MGIILDLIIVLIVVLTALMAARKGFIRTVIEVAGFVAAIFIASAVSQPLGLAAYRGVIEKPVVNAVSSSVNTAAGNLSDSVWNALPEFLTDNAEKFGISYELLSGKLNEASGGNAVAAAQTAADSLVKPIAVRLLSSIFFFLAFIALMFVVRLLARLLNRMLSFSLIGSLNKALGGAIGVVKGVIYAFVICTLIMLLLTLNGGQLWFINSEVISKSFIFRMLAQLTALYPLK